MPTETVKANPELRRAKGLLKLQQENQQGGAATVKILAISRLIQAIPANTLAQARSEMAMSAPANPSAGGPAAQAANAATDVAQENAAAQANPAAQAVPGTQASPPAAASQSQPAKQPNAAFTANDAFTSNAPGATAVDIPTNNGGMRMNPSATLVFGTDVEKLEYSNSGPQSFRELVIAITKEGEMVTTEGEVVFYIPVSWNFPTTGNRPVEAPLVGSGLVHITVPFGVAPDKDKLEAYVLTWRNPRTLGLSSDGAGASLVQAPIVTDVTPTGGTASITPMLQFQEQLSHAVTTAGNTLSIGGGPTTPIFSETVTVTTDTGGGHQEQSQVNVTDSFSMSFAAIVRLPQPQKLDTKATLTVHFRIDSDATASNGEEENITKWYQGLPKRLRTSIEGGKTRINLLGKASTTGSDEHNRQLAHRRVQHVQDILADLAGSDTKFHTQAIGRSQPHRQGEDQEERVVLVSLGDDAPKAVVADQT
jgi:outer membrane protein OmpA-like peptidoglycan-associated protein